MISIIASICYSLAWIIQARTHAAENNTRWPDRLSVLIAGVAVICHLLALGNHLFLPNSMDVNIVNLLALLTVLIVIFNWLIARRQAQELLELAIYPIAIVSTLLLEYADATPVWLNDLTALAATHIVSSLLAYALLSICALIAIQIAAQDAMLRRHQAVWLLQRIPLTALESLLFRLMSIGVLLLTVSLLSGIWFIDSWFAQHLVHKTILSLLSWLVFSILLFGRWRLGWRGLLAVRLTLAGMALLLLAYFGSKWVLEIVLERSWSGSK